MITPCVLRIFWPQRQKAAVLCVHEEPLFDWYHVNKFICCTHTLSCLFYCSCLGWQLSSTMTEAAMMPRHWVALMTLMATVTTAVNEPHPQPDTMGYQSALLHSYCTFDFVPTADQYFIFVYLCEDAIALPPLLKTEVCPWDIWMVFTSMCVFCDFELDIVLSNSFTMWELWNLLILELWLMALQINLT